jgi:hypothetical protein
MKIQITTIDKTGKEATTYTADFSQTEKAVKEAVDKLGSFLKTTFTKETTIKS